MDRKEYLNLGIKLCNELVKRAPIVPITSHHEGRQNSAKIEKNWIKRLPTSFKFQNKKVKIILPEKDDRSWVDLSLIYDNKIFYPINFKASKGQTADNISGLKYLGFLIFNRVDKTFNVPRVSSHSNLAKRIAELIKKRDYDLTNRDYFCMAYDINNENIRVIPVSSILSEHLKVNPSNIFQAKFHEAKFDINRNQKDAINFIIFKYVEYSKKRAEAYRFFKNQKLID
jgi:hypothetical protein